MTELVNQALDTKPNSRLAVKFSFSQKPPRGWRQNRGRLSSSLCGPHGLLVAPPSKLELVVNARPPGCSAAQRHRRSF
jgi:hypothetical protein